MQTYVYISNFAKAKKRSGEVWLSMAKDIFIEEGRKLKTIAEDGTSKPIELMKPVMVDGKPSLENDLTQANFDVAVDVGPTSSSRRSATVKSLTGIMAITQDPQTLQVLNSMVMMNMEGEGINDVRDYFRGQLVKMGVVKPTDEEAKAMAQAQANQPPDPNAEFLKASAEQATAQAAKDRAQTMKIIKDATKVEADTLVALNGINVAHAEHELKVMQHVGNMQQSQAPQ
jgi:hypothetical protein